MTEHILAEVSEGILQLTLARPDRKNAISLAMYSSLAEHILAAELDSSVRVLLLSGAGGCFTSGNDLQDFAAMAKVTAEDNPILTFMRALRECPKPVVVAVEGVAVGIGTTLLLHCDLVYAHPEARFSLPFVNLGLCPEYASSYLLPRRVGHARAAEWLLLGEPFDAAEALAAALVNAVVDDPFAVARAQCAKLAKQPPAALRQAKALLKGPTSQRVEKAQAQEVELFAQQLGGPEFAEAVTAFFEKRPADFSAFN